MKQKALLILFIFMMSLTICALPVRQIDGIYYGLDSETKHATVATSDRDKYTDSLTIPETVMYDGVTYIVTSIQYGFYKCEDLISVTIPKTVTSIGAYAFYGCHSLKTLTIHDTVKSIESNAFRGCYSLTSITIPNSVNSIGEESFYDCTGLTSITIPNSVTSIGAAAFMRCTGLTSVIIGNGVKSIGEQAFEYCSGIASVSIGNSVKSVGNGAFHNCTGLKSVHITDLEAWCNINFSEYYSNPLSYAHHLIMYDTELTDLIIPNDVTSINNFNFVGCNNLSSLTIPNSVTSIGRSAFANCSNLTSATIGNGLKKLEDYAFYYCSKLKTINIGNSLESVGGRAFQYCSSLTDVYCHAETVPTTEDDAFWTTSIANATLHVPEKSVSKYQTTIPWNKFGTFNGDILKCATPNIKIINGKLTFSCDTEGVEYVSQIEFPTSFNSNSDEIILPKIKITVYATKSGYEDSEVATKDINVGGGASGIRGDVNNDSQVGMPDAMFIVNKILNGKFPDE